MVVVVNNLLVSGRPSVPRRSINSRINEPGRFVRARIFLCNSYARAALVTNKRARAMREIKREGRPCR
jgi:hypothetical protein